MNRGGLRRRWAATVMVAAWLGTASFASAQDAPANAAPVGASSAAGEETVDGAVHFSPVPGPGADDGSAEPVAEAAVLGEVYAPPGAYVEETPAAEPDTSDPNVVGRVFAELGMSVLDAILVGAIGGFVGAGIGSASCGQPYFSSCGLVGGLTGHFVVAIGTIPLAVTWAGSWLDGRGDAGWAYVGELGGAALAGVLLAVSASVSSSGDGALASAIATVGSLALPPIGAILGYELADDSARASGPARDGAARRGPTLAPAVAFDTNRAVVGLGGSF